MNVVTQTASSVHFRMPVSMSRSIPETLQKPAAKTDGRCRAPSVFERLGHTGEMLSSRARAFAADTMFPLRVQGRGLLQRCPRIVQTIGEVEHVCETHQRVAVRVEEVTLRRERHRFACESLARRELTTLREDLCARVVRQTRPRHDHRGVVALAEVTCLAREGWRSRRPLRPGSIAMHDVEGGRVPSGQVAVLAWCVWAREER